MFFPINITPKANRPKNTPADPQSPSILILAPFQASPRVKLETFINTPAQAVLTIRNPHDRPLNIKISKLPPEERLIVMNPHELMIAPNSEENVHFNWTPREIGSWSDKVQFSDGRRLKYDINLLTTSKAAKKVPSKGNLRSFGRTLEAVQSNVSRQSITIQKTVTTTTTTTVMYEENKENCSVPKIRTRNVEKNAADNLNFSDIQLTPIRNVAVPKMVISQCPAIENNCGGAEANRVDFHPIDEMELSPANETDARRGTYVIKPDLKVRQTNVIIEEEEEEEEGENFVDSLSPSANKDNEQANFSAIINNLAAKDTPITKQLPFACSTLSKDDQKSKSSVENSVLNSTFSINGSSSSKNNSTYEIIPSPESSGSDRNFKPKNLMNRFNRTNDISSMDNSSVKAILEADLWVKGSNKSTLVDHNRIPPDISLKPSEASIQIMREGALTSQKHQKKRFDTFSIQMSPARPSISKRIAASKPVTKANCPFQHNLVQKKKTPAKSISSLAKRRGTIPKTRILKLSLATLNNSTVNASITSNSGESSYLLPESFVQLDAYAITMAEDPFLSNTLYYDLKWIHQQEKEFTKWLNALLTPPEQLDTDDEVKIDVGKLWQSCRAKDNVGLAESKDAVSARYHINDQLNLLRKAAYALFSKEEIAGVLIKVANLIEQEKLTIRIDCDVHKDVGLQKHLLQLFLNYNPLWLRIALEVVYNMKIPLQSNNDLIGITKFLKNHFFSDPYLVQIYSYNNVSTLKKTGFVEDLNKHILKKFLFVIYFLDYAKRSKLISHDPCLFNKNSEHKESRKVLTTFASSILSGVGDITKILRHYGYIVSHKQTYIEEYNYAVNNISTDLRDGVRLCRVMELIVGPKNLTNQCRVPAISLLQKIFNAKIALNALTSAGYQISGNIDGKSVAEGHREKTLSLIWQIIYKFQAPRYEKAAKSIQKWWRSKLIFVKLKRIVSEHRNKAVSVIQRAWRRVQAKRNLNILRKEREVYLKKRTDSALVIQTWWKNCKKVKETRQSFIAKRNAAIKIQKYYKRKRETKVDVAERQKKLKMIKTIQCKWQATLLMRKQRNEFLEMKQAVVVIQKRWIAYRMKKEARQTYQQLRNAAICIQRRWRAKKQMDIDRKDYLEKKKAAVAIQSWWRSTMIAHRERNEFILIKHSAKVISNWYISMKQKREDRQKFLVMRAQTIKSVEIIQRSWRRYRDTRDDVQQLESCRTAAITIQTWWRSVKAAKQIKQMKQKAITIQQWWRSLKMTRAIQSEYSSIKKAAIVLQKNWKMVRGRKNYLQKRTAAVKIQSWWKATSLKIKHRSEFVAKRNAVICIQRHFRNFKLTKQTQEDYLKRKKAAVTIQTRWRAALLARKQRNEFIVQKKAAVCIQNHFRNFKLAKQVREDYLKIRRAVVSIQTRWRAMIEGKKQRNAFIAERSAAICIQNHFRNFKLAKQVREDYLMTRKAVVSIQTRWRAVLVGRKQRNEFIAMRSAAILIQRHFRNFKLAKQVRENYLKSRRAAVTIQTHWRATLLARKQRNEFLAKRNAALCIQNHFRHFKLAEQVREDYLKIRRAATFILTRWRATLLARKQRNEFIAKRNAAICIQNHFRKFKSVTQVQNDYLKIRRAVVSIQIRWRTILEGRKQRNRFIAERNAAICIQRQYRKYVIAKKVREQFLMYRKAVITIQTRWRAKKYQKQNRAASIIQACWRGYKVRKEQSAQLAEIRQRVSEVTKNAVQSDRLKNKLNEKIYLFQNCRNVGGLCNCLDVIDRLTKYLPSGCKTFCEAGHHDSLYDLLDQANRSLPWFDVCIKATSILITFVKLPTTAAYIRQVDKTEIVVRLMTVAIKHSKELFLVSATFFWLLLRDDQFFEEVKHQRKTDWLLKNLFMMTDKLVDKRPTDRTLLPSVKYDWGFSPHPRYFLNTTQAVNTIKRRLKE